MYPALNFLPKEADLVLPNAHAKFAYQLFNQLHHYPTPSWASLLKWPVIKGLVVQNNPHLLQALRDLYRRGMQHLCQEFNQHHFLPEPHSCLDFLYSWLCFFPYWEWTQDEKQTIVIPQYLNHQWTGLQFQITLIELTPNHGWENLWLQTKDRYYAYILHRPDDPHAPTYIIYSGTTYPQGQGFISHIKSDLQPWHSVGETMMKTGATRLKNWLEEHQVTQAIALGLSLGGSLTLLTALAMPEHIQQGFAFNPAGMIRPLANETPTAPVRILIQGNDKVSKLGHWHPHWDLEHLNTDAAGFHLLDHFRIYSGHASRQYQALEVEQQNHAHPYLNFFLLKLCRPLIYHTLFLPYYYLIRPTLSLLWDAKYIIALSTSLLLLQLAPLPALGLGIFLASIIEANPLLQLERLQQRFLLASLGLIGLLAFSLMTPVNALASLMISLELLSVGLSLYEKLEPNKSFLANP